MAKLDITVERSQDVWKSTFKRYKGANPERLRITALQTLHSLISSFKDCLDNPKKTDITWERPYALLAYPIELSPNISDLGDQTGVAFGRLPTFTEELQDSKKASDTFRALSNGLAYSKKGDKLTLLVGPELYKKLSRLPEEKREAKLRSLRRIKPYIIPFWGRAKYKPGKMKKFRGNLVVRFHPMVIDQTPTQDRATTYYAYYPILVGFEKVKGYGPERWREEDRKDLWDIILRDIKAQIPPETLGVKEEPLPEPKVEPISPEVYKGPKEFWDISKKVFSITGLTEKDFRGYTEDRRAWWSKQRSDNTTLHALVKVDDLLLLDLTKKKYKQALLTPIPPKITASQLKNLDTLTAMLERENRKRAKRSEEKTASVEFHFRSYAKMRGYSDEEIDTGGNYRNELRRDLISGAITSFILEKEKHYHIGHFYSLEVPKIRSKEKWKVTFEEPYKTYLLNMGQYYPILLKAIKDRTTNYQKGYLYVFLKLLLSYKNTKTDFKTQKKVSNLLRDLQLSKDILARPKESFKVLCECINYVFRSYPGELEIVKFLSSGCEKVKPIADLARFKDYDYEQFKVDVLKDLGLVDVRDALISFNTPPKLKEAAPGIAEAPEIDLKDSLKGSRVLPL